MPAPDFTTIAFMTFENQLGMLDHYSDQIRNLREAANTPLPDDDESAVIPTSIATPVVVSTAWIVGRIEEILAGNPEAVKLLKTHHTAFGKIPVNQICGTCFSFVTELHHKKAAQAALLDAIVSGQIGEYVGKCVYRRKLVGLPGSLGALDHFLAFYPEKLRKVSRAICDKNKPRKAAPVAAPATPPPVKVICEKRLERIQKSLASLMALKAYFRDERVRVVVAGTLRKRTPRPPNAPSGSPRPRKGPLA
jgi:hypothetical protein